MDLRYIGQWRNLTVNIPKPIETAIQQLKQLKAYAEDLHRELLTCTDVGRIDFWGLPREAVFIEVDRAKLAQLGLNPDTIFATSRINYLQQLESLRAASGRILEGIQ